jgi:hypothetical protein
MVASSQVKIIKKLRLAIRIVLAPFLLLISVLEVIIISKPVRPSVLQIEIIIIIFWNCYQFRFGNEISIHKDWLISMHEMFSTRATTHAIASKLPS